VLWDLFLDILNKLSKQLVHPLLLCAFNPSPINILSDVRTKENISLIGKSPSGLNIYKFKYINDNDYYQGVMAQEVPHASTLGEDGFYKVDYSKVDVEFKKVN
jgi:hypothetical protein